MFPALRPSCWFIPSVIGELVSDPSPSETGSEGNQECVIGCIHGNLRSSVELATLGHPESDPETAIVTAATGGLAFPRSLRTPPTIRRRLSLGKSDTCHEQADVA
jgi:hypothetical protein